MDKSFVFIALTVFGGLVSGVNFMVSSLMFQQYYEFTFIFLLITIFFGIVFIGSLGFDSFEPYDKFKWKFGVTLAFAMTIIYASLFWTIVFEDAERELNTQCAEKGLSNKCTAEDMCGADCNELGKKYYRYEYSSGFFGPSMSDCWCKVNDKTEQIW